MEADKAQSLQLKNNAASAGRTQRSYDIVLQQFSLHTEGSTGDVLIDESDLTLLRGRKYALVGRNGVGKTTLMRHLANHAIVGIPAMLRIVLVDDGASFASEHTGSALQYLLQQHKTRLESLQRLQDALEAESIDIHRLEDVVEELRSLRSDAAESRAQKILLGLGVEPNVPMSTLSGGWKHRVALATALFVEADITLLDEPTNSLDLAAVKFLEKYIRESSQTVVVVSHDFAFIDSFAQTVIELAGRKLRAVDGDYTTFVHVREADLLQQQKLFRSQELRRKQTERLIETLRRRAEASPNPNGMIRSRVHMLETRLGQSTQGKWKYSLHGPRPEVLAPPDEMPVEFELLTDLSDLPDDCSQSDVLLIGLDGVGHKYTPEAPPCFEGVSFDITVSTRVALVGRNGTGKSTLLNIIVDSLKNSIGDVTRWCGVRVGFIDQHACKKLSEECTPLQWLQEHQPELTVEEALCALSAFGLSETNAQHRNLTHFSDGQRARVLLAALQLLQPHVVVLDEPTSHLDAESSQALATALTYFPGAVIVASHDRAFVSSLGAQLFVMDKPHFGFASFSMDEYADVHMAAPELPQRRPTSSNPRTATAKKAAPSSPPQQAAAAKAIPPVACRKCSGPHFTANCPNAASPKSPETTKPTPKPAEVVPLIDKKNGSWKVVVSKQTLRNLTRA